MKTDLQIAQEAKMLPITQIAENFGIGTDMLIPYGKFMAKIEDTYFDSLKEKKDAKLVLVTAINPTPAGEGKTTTTIGLAQAFNKRGKKAIVALREPSLGPCMGVKGGAAGGGYSQVLPMEAINLHFTGDLHAITSAHNLLSAMIDNSLKNNANDLDPKQIVWRRTIDHNDRALRSILIGLGGKDNGVMREDGFMITAASEIMAILCLSADIIDLKNRISRIIVGYTPKGLPVTAGDLNAQGAMTALLKDAIKPNLVQTIEHTPAFIHGGPFANIAHGCNSVRATKLALKLADIVITEAGFGADLGAEKFFDIKCRVAGLNPSAVVLVATIRALKYNGGVEKASLGLENVAALKAGCANLKKHIENLQKYNLPVVVALNHFTQDTDNEVNAVEEMCKELNCQLAISKVWEKGGEGGLEMADAVAKAIDENRSIKLLYEDEKSIDQKLEIICKEIYGADGVVFTAKAKKDLDKIIKLGFSHLPVCVAKTQYSLSDNAELLGCPKNFEVTVRELKISAGAGFVVALTGEIMTMPGLPKIPSACNIDVNDKGEISGLF